MLEPMSVDVVVRATGLKARRQELGLTQRQLAKLVGVTQNYIPAIETGIRSAGPELMDRLMSALKASFDDLFEVYLIEPGGKESRLRRK
jgi:transcriptional regulator with XRE-family HTH domain